MIPANVVTAVHFSIRDSVENKRMAAAMVQYHDSVKEHVPYPGGVDDTHMGTTDAAYACATCYNTKEKCHGHAGGLHLFYPIINPIALEEITKWLRIICLNCGAIVPAPSRYMRKFSPAERLKETGKLTRSGKMVCHQCGERKYNVTKHSKEPLRFVLDDTGDSDDQKVNLHPHNLEEIFSRITDESVINMNRPIVSHPRTFILRCMCVPPPNVRPNIRNVAGGRISNDELTTLLQLIVRHNTALPRNIPDILDTNYIDQIYRLNNSCYEFVRGTGKDGGAKSNAVRLKGKEGYYRKNMLGKRVRNCARGTITGDPSIAIDEIGIPLDVVRTMQYDEIVQEYNRARLTQCVRNGRKSYPGATKIIKRATGAKYDTDSLRDIVLEDGDTIVRDLIDGDVIYFNRQPSLAITNISTHRVVVLMDPTIKNFRMNASACALYNADFDGDAMNLIAVADESSRVEMRLLSAVPNWFISHTTSAPSVGQIEDAVIGMAEMTRTGVTLDKYHAMLLFAHSRHLPTFTKDLYTGREMITLALERTPINYTRRANIYDEAMADYIPYDERDIHVVIRNGVLEQGVIDKSSLGKGKHGNIYHVVSNVYGATEALGLMHDMQRMAIAFNHFNGFTIGINDIILPEKARAEVTEITNKLLTEAAQSTQRLNNGEIIPPIGETIKQTYDKEQKNTLRVLDDYMAVILRNIDPETNGLFKTIMSGAKGELTMMYAMAATVGQMLINGERMPEKFSHRRVSPFATRFSTDPIDYGFIAHPYIKGLTLRECFSNASSARFDLITKALTTAVTGYQSRISIKNLETITVGNMRWSMKGDNIVQIVFGEDYLDPRYVEEVEFPSVVMSLANIAKTYQHKSYPEQFAQILRDREYYHDVYLRFERMSFQRKMAPIRLLPANAARIVVDVMFADVTQRKPVSVTALADVMRYTTQMIDDLPYIFLNEMQRKKRAVVPDFLIAACHLMQMSIRMALHPNAIIEHRMNMWHVERIFGLIRTKYMRALIAPGTPFGIIAAQAFSEPLVQYMLDAHRRSTFGGSSLTGITKINSILGAVVADTLKISTMEVYLKNDESQAHAQHVANMIEVLRLSELIRNWQIFFERFGKPIHPKYAHEASRIGEFVDMNKLIPPPADLTNWCIRFSMDKSALIIKNISMGIIVAKLRQLFPDMYFVYTIETAEETMLRGYMRASMVTSDAVSKIVAIKKQLTSSVIRGVDGIKSATVSKITRSYFDDTGARKLRDAYAITTTGTNMNKIVTNADIDELRTFSDSVQEISDTLGIEAARLTIIAGMRSIIPQCNHRHYVMYADEMVYTGRITSIRLAGLKAREVNNALLAMGFATPTNAIRDAAVNAVNNPIIGVTAPLLIGSTPRLGTTFNRYMVNEAFVRANMKSADAVIAAL